MKRRKLLKCLAGLPFVGVLFSARKRPEQLLVTEGVTAAGTLIVEHGVIENIMPDKEGGYRLAKKGEVSHLWRVCIPRTEKGAPFVSSGSLDSTGWDDPDAQNIGFEEN